MGLGLLGPLPVPLPAVIMPKFYELISMFPKIRGNLFGVPIIRTLVFWSLYWGPLILGNYHNPCFADGPAGSAPHPQLIFESRQALGNSMPLSDVEITLLRIGRKRCQIQLLPYVGSMGGRSAEEIVSLLSTDLIACSHATFEIQLPLELPNDARVQASCIVLAEGAMQP